MHRHDPGLKALIETASERTFLTYQMVDDYLPDEGGESTMVDSPFGQDKLPACRYATQA